LLSRSRTRKRVRFKRSVKPRLRACWVTQLPAAFAVQPARWTRRLSTSGKNSPRTAERDRLHGEEIACQHAGRLLAQERPQLRRGRLGAGSTPALASRRRTVLAETETPSSTARRRSADIPNRGFCRESRSTSACTSASSGGGPAFRRLRPLPPHQLAMPAQQRLRYQREPLPPPRRRQTRERGDEGTIGGHELRALASPAKPRQPMAARQSARCRYRARTAAMPDEQPQHGPQREVGERKKHPATLSRSTRESADD
jgi:hypothetical protein